MKIFSDLNEFAVALGSQLGPTDGLQIDQDRVNLFAEATDDHQWIHVDPERAADGPFGATITVEIEDSTKPAAVAESIVRYIA
ncbi:MaoC/PaaZ C-terminal domain-containing protein [Mycolicibacterium sp.]|uniref:MaoC/PaaZ C-terminal domain-containing protein n=1 Tax=Mycolicibacterium sp. TaxID=2320850 RepID=UPI001A3531DD|nr:MaoC/PaaZ C-terminal domain-containing protein [Mycolicibacterium sp.]MBJ7336158.1 hypothetical protein [Mycolicibacterium sp.]